MLFHKELKTVEATSTGMELLAPELELAQMVISTMLTIAFLLRKTTQAATITEEDLIIHLTLTIKTIRAPTGHFQVTIMIITKGSTGQDQTT